MLPWLLDSFCSWGRFLIFSKCGVFCFGYLAIGFHWFHCFSFCFFYRKVFGFFSAQLWSLFENHEFIHGHNHNYFLSTGGKQSSKDPLLIVLQVSVISQSALQRFSLQYSPLNWRNKTSHYLLMQHNWGYSWMIV